jgi:predicted transposase YbfD/YdcC
MESKLNQEAISQYSSAFTGQVLQQAYQHKPRLNGQEILSLTPLKQVNLLLIRELFLHWKKETRQLRSPYFDYEAAEVQRALETFMDVLSQHIAVDEAHLKPLLEKASRDTLVLVLAPYDFFFLMLTHTQKDHWKVEELEDLLRYVKINRPLLESLIQRCREEEEGPISPQRIVQLFDEAFGRLQEPPEDTEPYIRLFDEVKPLRTEELFSQTFEPQRRAIPEPEAPAQTATEPESEESREQQRTLNDLLNRKSNQTLADLHQQQKIGQLSSHINMNQKFMFIKELFNNDKDAFWQSIEQLDQQNSYAEAMGIVRNELAPRYHWKMDSEEVVELMELLSRRY